MKLLIICLSITGFVQDESIYAENGKKGTYFFEFSRPWRTMDHLQQDEQFTLGESSNMSVAFWYPVDSLPWHSSRHYSINYDWVAIDISQSSFTSLSGKSGGTALSSSCNIAIAFSLYTFSSSTFCVCVCELLSFTSRGCSFSSIG